MSNVISRQQTTGSEAGFDRFDLRSELRSAIVDAGYTEPRPIQARALKPALNGKDVLGLAQTGTGKTAAFVLPILERLCSGRLARAHATARPRALVVAPTRELAAQIHGEFEALGKNTRVRSSVVFGGVPVPRQIRELKRGIDVLVACPGRLLDLVQRRAVALDHVEVLVLDEADHMFDLGFLPDVRRILRELPGRRQNLLFSATMPREVRGLADQVLRNPVVIELAHSKPAERIAHGICHLSESDKTAALDHLLDGQDFHSAIVFLRTKRRVKRLAERLDRRGHAAIALQGNMSQPQRERALSGFRDGRYSILVATDIAARGLDVDGVSHVVNYDLPTTPDAYTHRIGRTGRSGRSGSAYTFVTGEDRAGVLGIEKMLGEKLEHWDLPMTVGSSSLRSNGSAGRSGARSGQGARKERQPQGRNGRGRSRSRANSGSKTGASSSSTGRGSVAPKAARAPQAEPAKESSDSSRPFGAGLDSNGQARKTTRKRSGARGQGRDRARARR